MSETQPASRHPATSAAADLRRLWEAGRRREGIRAVLDQWPSLLDRGEELNWLERALRTSGLRAEAFAVSLASARRHPGDATVWESLVRSVLHSGDPWWARRLVHESGVDSRTMRALAVEAELALANDASAQIFAWTRSYTDAEARDKAVDWWIRCGHVEEAERLLAQSDDDADTPGLLSWRARLALWRTEPAAARGFLDRLPDSPQTRCMAAIAAVQEGRLDEAETALRALAGLEELRGEASSWLATVLRKRGRYADAVRAAEAAIFARPSFSLANRLELDLSDEQNKHRRVWPLHLLGLYPRHRIRDMEHAHFLYPLGLRPGDRMASTVGALLERFGGNHRPDSTFLENGRLHSYRVPIDPRNLGANIQRVLWTRGVDAVRDLYREIRPFVQAHPLFRIYEGEIELWLGNYAEAERIFRTVIDRNRDTRWAWIGLGASVMYQGDLRQAQRLWKRMWRYTTAGPTLYVYRGECYRRQGDVARARKGLDFALREKPHRLSAQINHALLDGEPAALARVVGQCEQILPLLMEELKGSPEERLEQVLLAMRGNRSSSPWHVSYHMWGRLWRRSD